MCEDQNTYYDIVLVFTCFGRLLPDCRNGKLNKRDVPFKSQVLTIILKSFSVVMSIQTGQRLTGQLVLDKNSWISP